LAQSSKRQTRSQSVVRNAGTQSDHVEAMMQKLFSLRQSVLLEAHAAERDVQTAHGGKLLLGPVDDLGDFGMTATAEVHGASQLPLLVSQPRLMESRLGNTVVVSALQRECARFFQSRVGLLRLLECHVRVSDGEHCGGAQWIIGWQQVKRSLGKCKLRTRVRQWIGRIAQKRA